MQELERVQAAGCDGGDATVTISGTATSVKCGSIGGGTSDSGAIGKANVTINEGNIQAQIIMQGAGSTFEMNGGTIDNAAADRETFAEPNGGAVYIKDGTATISGGTIKNCSAENGGAIYVAGGNVSVEGGKITGNKANQEGGAIYVSGGNVIVGTKACYEASQSGTSDHVHPEIKANTADKQGGALSVHAGAVSIYCGTIDDNKAAANRMSDSIYQGGGQIDIWSGYIATGSVVTDGTLRDHRTFSITIRLHDNLESGKVITITDNKEGQETPYSYILPSEMEGSSKPGFYICGWAVSPDGTQDYLPVGSEAIITSETVDYYAVWKKLAPSYTVTIPDRWNAENEAVITANLMYFEDSQSLKLAVSSANNFQMQMGSDAQKKMGYTLFVDEKRLDTDGLVATFSNSNTENKILTIQCDNTARYSGEYSDTLTFTATLANGIDNKS